MVRLANPLIYGVLLTLLICSLEIRLPGRHSPASHSPRPVPSCACSSCRPTPTAGRPASSPLLAPVSPRSRPSSTTSSAYRLWKRCWTGRSTARGRRKFEPRSTGPTTARRSWRGARSPCSTVTGRRRPSGAEWLCAWARRALRDLRGFLSLPASVHSTTDARLLSSQQARVPHHALASDPIRQSSVRPPGGDDECRQCRRRANACAPSARKGANLGPVGAAARAAARRAGLARSGRRGGQAGSDGGVAALWRT